ncbi:MAG: AMP-binding protein, partial [Muribaculaceae bacterium]|nr:AMP-binding protein [Muribaculaceae bacterium]
MHNILTDLVGRQTRHYGTREVFYSPGAADGEWVPTSWDAFNAQVEAVACGLDILGLKETEMIAVFSANRPGVLVTDFAAYANRAVPVSIYATSSADQVQYIVNDSGARLLFVGDQKQYDIAREVFDSCPSLTRIIAYSDIAFDANDTTTMTLDALIKLGESAGAGCREEVARRRAAATPDDIATLIYTSGTTGEPKGAVLPHSCFDAAMEIHRERLTMLSEDDTSISFLPLSHIFEKAWTYFCLYMGMKVWINLDPRQIQQTVAQVRPTCLCSVPRFWEKVYTGVQEKLNSMNPVVRALARRAIKIGRRRNLDYDRLGLKAPWWLEKRYQFYSKVIF